MKQELYVIIMPAKEDLYYFKGIRAARGEFEIKMTNKFGDAQILSDLETCKLIINKLEQKDNFSIYKIELKEVAE